MLLHIFSLVGMGPGQRKPAGRVSLPFSRRVCPWVRLSFFHFLEQPLSALSEDLGVPIEVEFREELHILGNALGLMAALPSIAAGALNDYKEAIQEGLRRGAERREREERAAAKRAVDIQTNFWSVNEQWNLHPDFKQSTVDLQGNYMMRIVPNTRHPNAEAYAVAYDRAWYTLVRQARSADVRDSIQQIPRATWVTQYENFMRYFDPTGYFSPFVLNMLGHGRWDDRGHQAFLFEATTDRLGAYRGPRSMRLKSKLKFMLQIAQIIEALHADKLLHRDITSDHFYFTPGDMHGRTVQRVKISNFYQATHVESVRADGLLVSEAPVQKPLPRSFEFYAAPEVVASDGKIYTSKSEIYSVGILFYEFLTGHRPEFQGRTKSHKLRAIRHGFAEAGITAAEELVQLLDEMLANSQEERVSCMICWSKGRPSASEVVERLEAMQG